MPVGALPDLDQQRCGEDPTVIKPVGRKSALTPSCEPRTLPSLLAADPNSPIRYQKFYTTCKHPGLPSTRQIHCPDMTVPVHSGPGQLWAAHSHPLRPEYDELFQLLVETPVGPNASRLVQDPERHDQRPVRPADPAGLPRPGGRPHEFPAGRVDQRLGHGAVERRRLDQGGIASNVDLIVQPLPNRGPQTPYDCLWPAAASSCKPRDALQPQARGVVESMAVGT